MNGLLRLALSPLAGFAAHQTVRFISEPMGLAAGAAAMLALALLPGSSRGTSTQD